MFNDCSLTIALLDDHPELLQQCCDFLNSEWKRSSSARLQLLKKSSKHLPNSLLLLEQNEGNFRIIGHSRLSRILEDCHGVWIASVLISPDKRGRGFGKYLMTKAEEHAKMLGLSTAYLNTHDKQGFYEHIGYTYCSSVSPVGFSCNGNFLLKCENYQYPKLPNEDFIQSEGCKRKNLPNEKSKNILPPMMPPPPPPPPPLSHLNSTSGIQTNGFKSNLGRYWMKKSL